MKEKRVSTDILVIGGGGAGAMAAIKAHKQGANVILVTKNKFPSGCTPLVAGAIQAALDPKDSEEKHYNDTLKGGEQLNNPVLVKIMVDEAKERVVELDKFGTNFRKKDGEYMLFPIGGCSLPRAAQSHEPYNGGFIEGLVKEVRRRNIHVIENVVVTKLLKANGRVVGATGFDTESGEFLVFSSRATILATGGAGRLYPLTTNPPEVSGDGYALAYKAGASLLDMEFIQGRACIISPPSMRGTPPPIDGLGTIGGRFYNVLGERYMKKYYPDLAEKVTRDAIAISAFKEIRDGKGTPEGGVYNDLSGVPDKELERFAKFVEKAKAAGIDPSWQPIKWAPGVHHFMGGVRINADGETNVDGLYAAGEVTGGIHGANRMGGNALTDILVFGARAGIIATQRVESIPQTELPTEDVKNELNRIKTLKERDGGPTEIEFREKIHDIMNSCVGVIRNQTDLSRAVKELSEIQSKIGDTQTLSNKDSTESLLKALENVNQVTVGLMVAKAALMRKESRGAHCREDYSDKDDSWKKNIVITKEDDEMKLLIA